MEKPKPTLERVLQLLDYDKKTGTFRWKPGVGHRHNSSGFAGTQRRGYIRIMIDRKAVNAHHLAWLISYGVWPDAEVDHIDGVRGNNRVENLRLVDRSLNMQNQRRARSNSKTGFLGVSVMKHEFMASIGVRGKRFYLGTFKTAEEAHRAYLEAKRRLHENCAI